MSRFIFRFSAVIFDMDGVLVDSEPVHLESTIRMMSDDFGLPFTEEDNKEFLGSTDRHMYEVLKQRHNLPLSRDALIERRKAIYLEMLRADGIPWRDGIVELVRDLASNGVRIALASSGLRRVIEMILDTGEISQHFEAVVTGDDVHTPKPSPEIYLEAIRQLGVSPGTSVAIEDTDVGVRSAKAAGASAIAFPAPSTAHMDFTPGDTQARSVEDIRSFLLQS